MSRDELVTAVRTALDAAGLKSIRIDAREDGLYLTARNTRDAYPNTSERIEAMWAARTAVRKLLIEAGVSKTVKHRGHLVWCLVSQHEMCAPVNNGHRCGYRWPAGV